MKKLNSKQISELDDGLYPIHRIAQRGIHELISMYKDELNKKSKADGHTPLYYAVEMNQPTFVEKLLRNGVDLDLDTRNGFTLLHRAVIRGHIEIVKILLDEGLDINATSDNGDTLLYLAKIYSHPAIEALLIERGAIELDEASTQSPSNKKLLDALHLKLLPRKKSVLQNLEPINQLSKEESALQNLQVVNQFSLERIKGICLGIKKIKEKYFATNKRRKETLQELNNMAQEFESYVDTFSNDTKPALSPLEAVTALEEQLVKILINVKEDHKKNKSKIFDTESRLVELLEKIIEKSYQRTINYNDYKPILFNPPQLHQLASTTPLFTTTTKSSTMSQRETEKIKLEM